MRKTLLPASLLALCCCQANADTLGFHFGYGNWNQDVGGVVQLDGAANNPTNIDRIDPTQDLGHDSSDGMMIWAALEHPIPVLPNIRVGRTEAKSTANKDLTVGINFGDITIDQNVNVDSQLDLTHNDYVLYYEVLDNWVELDLGVDIKHFDGVARVEGGGEREFEQFDELIPFLYTSVNFNLPLTGLKVGGDYAGISYGGARGQDYRLRIAYEFSFGLGIEAGQRKLTLEVDDSDEEFNGDIDFDGSYIAATFHF